jgi:hypothetical protein
MRIARCLQTASVSLHSPMQPVARSPRRADRRSIGLGAGTWLAGLLALLVLSSAQAQQTFPTPVLTSISPAGAKAGSTVEVTLNGIHLEEDSVLHFSTTGFKIQRMPEPPNPNPKKPKPPGPPRYKVTVPPGIQPGIVDVRVEGKWGVSNPRAFAIGELPELAEKEPNNDVPQAQKINLNSTINGLINPATDVDYFSFTGKKGQRVLVHCAAFSIDSRLNPYLRLYDAGNRELTSNRNYRNRDAVLDFVLPADGDYVIRLTQFTHIGGGTDYFYRLTAGTLPWIDAAYPPVVQAGKSTSITLYGRNLPGGQEAPEARLDGESIQKLTAQVTPPALVISERRLEFRGTALPRCGGLDGFGYRVKNGTATSNPVLLTVTDLPVVLDRPDNDDPEKPQEVTAPCEIAGRIEKRGDRDHYVFTAKKGDVLSVEGYADRLRSPLDLYFVIRRADNKQTIGEFDDSPNLPQRLGQFFTYSADPQARFVAPADGKYLLMVSGRAAGVRFGPRQVYRLSLRREEPDYRLLLVGNNDLGGCTVRQGSSQDFQVVCYREDGFDGPVVLTVEGLPSGLSCPPQIIGPRQRDASLVFTAAPGAGNWTGPVRVKGTATIGGKKVVREARAGCLVWPTTNQNLPAVSRLARSLWLAVRSKGPFSLEPVVKELSVAVGNQAAFKLRVKRLMPDYKANVQVTRRSVPVRKNGQPVGVPNVNIAPDKEVEIKFNLPGDTVPGEYDLVFQGTGQFPFTKTPKGKKQNVRAVVVSSPLRLTIYDQVAEVSTDKPAVTLKPGGQQTLSIRVKRLHGYKGPFTVQVVLPSGFGGVSAATLTIPAGANEGKLILKAAAGAKPASTPALTVRATAKVERATLTQEGKLAVTIVK